MAKVKLSTDDAIKVLQEEKIGRLATCGGEYPYVVPLCYVYHRGAIYFHSGFSGEKLEHIKQDNRVCFQVDRVDGCRASRFPCSFSITYKSVLVFGRASVVEDREEKREALFALALPFAEGAPLEPVEEKKVDITNVIRIDIDKITGKANVP